MPSYALLTTVGRNKEAAALASASDYEITHMAWGDGDHFPSGGETALQNEIGRKPLNGKGITPGTNDTAFFDVLLAENEGPFVIREAGLFDVDGDLIAIARYDPPINKPLNTVSAVLRINVLFSDLENLVLKVEAASLYAPQSRVFTAGNGLVGGGDLSADRSLAVDFATSAEVQDGQVSNKAVAPDTLAQKIDAAINALVDGAPAALDTLKELADELGDNDNAIAALTAQIGTKLNASQYTSADILAKLKTVDGGGSGLDADKVDGIQLAQLMRSDIPATAHGTLSTSVNGLEQFRVGYDTDATRDVRASFFRGGTTLHSFIDTLVDRMRIEQVGGAQLDLVGVGDARLNGVPLLTSDMLSGVLQPIGAPVDVTTSVGSVEFTLDTTNFSRFELHCERVIPTSSGPDLYLYFSDDGGVTWLVTGYDSYSKGVNISRDGSTGLVIAGQINNSASEYGVDATVSLFEIGNVGKPSRYRGFGHAAQSNGYGYPVIFGGRYDANVAHDAIKVQFSAGSVASGRFQLYGEAI